MAVNGPAGRDPEARSSSGPWERAPRTGSRPLGPGEADRGACWIWSSRVVWVVYPRRRRGRRGKSSPPAELSQPLDDGGIGHAAALAHRLEAVPAATALQLVQQRGHQLGAAGAQRMAKRDRAAVDVGALEVGAGLALPGEHHRGERFVDLVA